MMGSIGTIRTRAGAHIAEVAMKASVTVQEVIDNTLVFLRDRSTAYRRTFDRSKLDARVVMKDLLTFSKWGDTSFVENDRLAERLRGRQDVVLRILQHQVMTPRQLMALLNSSPVPILDQEDSEDENG
jgi:hypothetical protein